MKRLISLILCAALMLCLSACTAAQDEFIYPITFYYLQVQHTGQLHHGSVHSIIAPELREGDELRHDLTEMLKLYMDGPEINTFRTPFPAGTRVIGWEMDGTTLCITLSDEAAILTGIDLTLACACLTKTCLELHPCGAVRVRAENLTLDGKASITMNESILLLLDDTNAGTEPNAP